MALFGPARGPGFVVRLAQRLVSLRFWLRTLLGLAVAGLFIVPSGADLVNALTRPVESDAGPCRIMSVVDGDTVTLMCGETGIGWARILGYDSPEKYAPKCLGEFLAAERAGWALRTLIRKADRIVVAHEGVDTNGRTQVRMTLDGVDAARAMIRTGHARAFGGGLRGSWCP